MDAGHSTGPAAPCQCRRCGNEFNWERQPGQRGRPKLYCSAACMKGAKAHPIVESKCETCGRNYGRRRDRLGRYCSRSCQQARKREPKDRPSTGYNCHGCGVQKTKSAAWSAIEPNNYCSMPCYQRTRKHVAAEVEGIRRLGRAPGVKGAMEAIARAYSQPAWLSREWWKDYREGRAERPSPAAYQARKQRQDLWKAQVAALKSLAAHSKPRALRALRTVCCVNCGAEFSCVQVNGRPRTVCDDCLARSRSALQAKSRAVRKSRIKATAVEKIDPITVFESEGWICYLCGVLTDKTKRGTCDPLAPELEHVIPLSKGGTHTRDNVRCACRRCNGQKADAVPLAA